MTVQFVGPTVVKWSPLGMDLFVETSSEEEPDGGLGVESMLS